VIVSKCNYVAVCATVLLVVCTCSHIFAVFVCDTIQLFTFFTALLDNIIHEFLRLFLMCDKKLAFICLSKVLVTCDSASDTVLLQ